MGIKTVIPAPNGLINLQRKCLNKSHPENPNRIKEIMHRLQSTGLLEQLQILPDIPEADKGDVTMVHDPDYYDLIANLETQCQDEINELSTKYDSVQMCPGTPKAAISAVSCARALTELVVENKIPNGFAIIRPPGHHALRDEANGFCIFNSVALAAHAALNSAADRVLILDWDVHHGQGTQREFYDDRRVLYISLHRYENGKYCPHLQESNFHFVGEGPGLGYNVNIPINETGATDADYMFLLFQLILPIVREFQPHIILVSAGFDACDGDPVGKMCLSPALFAQFTYHLLPMARGKMVLMLEGGYHHKMQAACVEKCVRILMGEKPEPLSNTADIRKSTISTFLDCASVLQKFWKCFQFFLMPKSSWETHFAKPVFTLPTESDVSNTGNIEQANLPYYESVNKNTEKTAIRTGFICDEKFHSSVSDVHFNQLHQFESGYRIKQAYQKFKTSGLMEKCVLLSSNRSATVEELTLVHDKRYIDDIANGKDDKNVYDIASLAVGCTLKALDGLYLSEDDVNHIDNVFALIRPPGHHATKDKGAGYCTFNNVAIAAKYALAKNYAKKIMIFDWDVHHGNGIQEVFYENNQVLYISIHRHDRGTFYPVGELNDVTDAGRDDGLGFTINIPFDTLYGDKEMMAVFSQIVLPVAYEFDPDLVLISAGFDACEDDPIGECHVTPQCFSQMTWHLMGLAKGKLCMVLEGGYNAESVAKCVEAVVKTLSSPHCNPEKANCDDDEIEENTSQKVTEIDQMIWETIRNVTELHSEHWKCFQGIHRKLNFSQVPSALVLYN
ncbi:histone deacetylase domain-containing protein [Ditylenchus destructor]|nr:histone deacetylase domain-containing protein [Ditylenchus destructor]